MRRRFSLSMLIALASASASACTGQSAVEPTLVVERWDRARECFVHCAGSAERPVAEFFEDICEGGGAGDSDGASTEESEDCNFEGGWEDARLTVDFGALEFPSGGPGAPKAQLSLDDGDEATMSTFRRSQQIGERWLSQRRVSTPVDHEGTLAFVVEVDTDTFISSPKYGLTEPTIEFTFDGCEQGQPSTNCPRVAGVGTVEVRAVGPVGLPDTTMLSVENQIVGGPLEPATTVNFVNQGDHRLARTFVAVDDVPGQDWVLSARVGDQPDSRTYALVASDITVTVPQCPANEDQCSLPAGLGSVVVDITAPPNTAATQATLVSAIDGVTINTETVALSGTANNPKTGSKMLAVPDQLGRWLLEARVGASVGQRESIELRPATDITLVLGDRALSDQELCSGAVEPPPRAALEPTAACRELALCVLAPDRPANGQIAITTNIGQVGGQSGQATLTIDDTGQAVLDVDLPTSVPSDPRLILEGSAEGVSGVPLVYALAPVLPIGPGTLNSPVNVATVGETGSSSITLSGQLPLPQGASLASDARLTVRVEAEPAAAPVGLPCGPSISDAALDCDPSQGNPGGCVLAPLEVPVSADGSYSIPLAGGICFEGTVTVSALGLVYDDNSATCLGERPAQTDESAVGQASPLTYQP